MKGQSYDQTSKTNYQIQFLIQRFLVIVEKNTRIKTEINNHIEC